MGSACSISEAPQEQHPGRALRPLQPGNPPALGPVLLPAQGVPLGFLWQGDPATCMHHFPVKYTAFLMFSLTSPKSMFKFHFFWRAFLYSTIKVTLMWSLQPCVLKIPSPIGERLNRGQISLVLPLPLNLYLNIDEIPKMPLLKILHSLIIFKAHDIMQLTLPSSVAHWPCWSTWPKLKKKPYDSLDFAMQYCSFILFHIYGSHLEKARELV